jgi:Zn finger protein HypA/HybF involved in hydrogenase expression
MKKQYTTASILFTCPQCNANFEFDAVGEYELVACPVCGTRHVTVKVGSKLMLQPSELALLC